jgi:simple sugar transport system permease protein
MLFGIAAAWAVTKFRFKGRSLLVSVIDLPFSVSPVIAGLIFVLLFGAACAGLAGAYLSTMRVQGFVENMTEGQGFLALAIVIFGRWHAGGVLAAALFFGGVRAVANVLETRSGYGGATLQLFKILPYAVSLLALAGVAGRSGAPAALGRAYARE